MAKRPSGSEKSKVALRSHRYGLRSSTSNKTPMTSTATSSPAEQGSKASTLTEEEDRPASARVLDLPELLGQVLVNLNARELFAVARVNRTFNATLKLSGLQKKMRLARNMDFGDGMFTGSLPFWAIDCIHGGLITPEYIHQSVDIIKHSSVLWPLRRDTSKVEFLEYAEQELNRGDRVPSGIEYCLGPLRFCGASRGRFQGKEFIKISFCMHKNRYIKGLGSSLGPLVPDSYWDDAFVRSNAKPSVTPSWMSTKILDFPMRVCIVVYGGHPFSGFSWGGRSELPSVSDELSIEDATVGNLFKRLQYTMEMYDRIIGSRE